MAYAGGIMGALGMGGGAPGMGAPLGANAGGASFFEKLQGGMSPAWLEGLMGGLGQAKGMMGGMGGGGAPPGAAPGAAPAQMQMNPFAYTRIPLRATLMGLGNGAPGGFGGGRLSGFGSIPMTTRRPGY